MLLNDFESGLLVLALFCNLETGFMLIFAFLVNIIYLGTGKHSFSTSHTNQPSFSAAVNGICSSLYFIIMI